MNWAAMRTELFSSAVTLGGQGARASRTVGTVELPQVQVRLSWTTLCLACAPNTSSVGAVIQPPNLGSTDENDLSRIPTHDLMNESRAPYQLSHDRPAYS